MAFKYLENKKGFAPKERRKPYRGAAAVDPCCRNHGGCPWCQSNRTFAERKRKLIAEEKLLDFKRS